VRHLILLLGLGMMACSPSPQGHEVVLLPFPDDAGAVTWDGWAGAFVRDYCTECHQPSAPCGGNGCHAAGDPALWDFHDKTAFTDRADLIKCGIATVQDPSWNCTVPPKKFPIIGQNPLPVDEQRDIMVGWIDAGCP
jgi:hypothetical protein